MHTAVFDIDGTLTDTNVVDERCYMAALQDEFHIGVVDLNTVAYPDVTDSAILNVVVEQAFGREPTDAERQRFITRFVARLRRAYETTPAEFAAVPGAPHFVGVLQSIGWQLAVATGGWKASARLKLGWAGVELDGAPLATADDDTARTAIVRYALQRAAIESVRPEDKIVFVGDGLWDLEAAAQLGISFLGVGTGPHAAKLHARGASTVIPDFRDSDQALRALSSATCVNAA